MQLGRNSFRGKPGKTMATNQKPFRVGPCVVWVGLKSHGQWIIVKARFLRGFLLQLIHFRYNMQVLNWLDRIRRLKKKTDQTLAD